MSRERGLRIECGDCLEVLEGVEDGSVDVIVTSPPHNLGVACSTHGDRRAETEYLEWMVRVAGALRRVLRHDGSIFLNIAGSSTQPWLPFELIVRLRDMFSLQNHITWVKSIALPGDSVGHFKPVPGERFLHQTHEHIFHLTHRGDVSLDRLALGVPFKDRSSIARRGDARDLRCRGDTWLVPYEIVQYSHPGTFPIDLPRWCIRLHGKPRAVVLDPFCGSGTTLVAALEEGCSGIGIEIDSEYAAIAEARLAAVTVV